MSATTTNIEALAGARVLVLNWRDVRHPQAGGAEQYMHQISRRWRDAGVDVTWSTARPKGQPADEELDGVPVHRAGGALSLYPRTAAALLRTRGRYDAIVDCQNGIPFFSPLFAGRDVPVVQLVHHVHQDQFATLFSPAMAAVGRVLERDVARAVYGRRAIAAVSPSTRTELRDRLGFRGPIFVVPNGTDDLPAGVRLRATRPTLVLVSRLVPHKRVDLLVGQLAAAVEQVPDLAVHVVGDGPERARLQGLVADLGLQDTVTFHGRLPDTDRDELLSRAWLTTSTSAAEGWGCSVIEAAAFGVPCLALRAPGIRDAVLDGETGWLVERPEDFGAALVRAVGELSDVDRATEVAAAGQDWARCFTWDRSAELLAGVVLDQIRRAGTRSERRAARSDMAVLAGFRRSAGADLRGLVRPTDEVVVTGQTASVLLNGCDEFDATTVLQRLGARESQVRMVDRRELLAGPAAPAARTGTTTLLAGLA